MTLRDVLRREGLSEDVIEQEIQEARDMFNDYLEYGHISKAENACAEAFGTLEIYLCDITDTIEVEPC